MASKSTRPLPFPLLSPAVIPVSPSPSPGPRSRSSAPPRGPASPVARPAIRQTLNLVRLHQVGTERELVRILLAPHIHRLESRGLLVLHAEHLVARPHVFLRLAVALRAPAHQQCVRLPGERHLRDRPVAGGAADALVDV